MFALDAIRPSTIPWGLPVARLVVCLSGLNTGRMTREPFGPVPRVR